MTARNERLSLEIAMAKKAFANNKNVFVARSGKGLLTKCRVTYLVKGLQKLPDNIVETVERHRLEIYFPPFYPFLPPIFKFVTPIWHPSVIKGFLPLTKKEVDSKSLVDIIIYIGQIIQYREFPTLSLNKEALQWSKDNKELWPNGRKKLLANKDITVETESVLKTSIKARLDLLYYKFKKSKLVCSYVQSGFSMKTVLKKFVLSGLIAASVAFAVTNLTASLSSENAFAWRSNLLSLSDYFEYTDDANEAFSQPNKSFHKYCKKNKLDPENENSYIQWYIYDATPEEAKLIDKRLLFNNVANIALNESLVSEFDYDNIALEKAIRNFVIKSKTIKFIIISFFLTFALLLSDRWYYGKKKKSIFVSFSCAMIVSTWCLIFGVAAQFINQLFIVGSLSKFTSIAINLLSWTLLGLSVGFITSITKESKSRQSNFIFGGLVSGFISGLAYNSINNAFYNSNMKTFLSILFSYLIISFTLGVFEQLTKHARLKVINGANIDKEYLILDRKTYVGHNNDNNIVIKEQNIAPRHLVIFNDDNKFVLIDYKSAEGTLVNEQPVSHAVLKNGDKITVGKCTLEFVTK